MADIVIIALVIAYCIFLYVRHRRKKKNGETGCSGCCGCCANCGGCAPMGDCNRMPDPKS